MTQIFADLFWLFFKNPRLSASSAEKLGQPIGLTKRPFYGKVEYHSLLTFLALLRYNGEPMIH